MGEAMRKFLLHLLLFSLGVLSLLALAEWLARSCPNAYRIKDNWVQQHAGEVETLVLGSSHAYADLKPDHLGAKAYNLANSNQTPRYDWLLLSRDSARFSSLRTVVYPSSSLLMNYPLESTSEWYRCIYYQLYNHLERHSVLSRYAWEAASIQTCCWKVQSYFISGAADRMCDDYGWCTYYQVLPSSLEKLNAHELSSRMDKYAERLPMLTADESYIDQIAQLCERRGWRLLLLGAPVSTPFYSDPRGREHLQRIDDAARKVSARYTCVEYRDYSHDTRFQPDDFFDVDHLNERGAERFSSIVREDFQL